MALGSFYIDLSINKNDDKEHTLAIKNYRHFEFSSDTIKNITEVVISENENTCIPSLANAINLKKVTLPNTLTSIPYGMFSGCSSLIDINIPTALLEIGPYAFEGCSNLKKLIIPENVEVDSTSFNGVTSMDPNYVPPAEIIPSEDFSEEVIGDTHILHHYTLANGTPWLEHPEYNYEIEADSTMSFVPALWTCGEDVLIPPEVTNIKRISFDAQELSVASYAFVGLTQLTSMTIYASNLVVDEYGYNIFLCAMVANIFEKYPDEQKLICYLKTDTSNSCFARSAEDGQLYKTNDDGDFVDSNGNVALTTSDYVVVSSNNYYITLDATYLPLNKDLIVAMPNISFGILQNMPSWIVGLTDIPLFKLADNGYYRFTYEDDTENDSVIRHDIGPANEPYEINEWDDYLECWT